MKKLILISMVFILAACGPGGETELSHNQQKWLDAGISHYRFELTLSCFCPFRSQMPLTVEVLDGSVDSVVDVNGTVISSDDPNYQFFVELGTIDLIFTEIENATENTDAGEIVVTYDETLGFPSEVSIDYIKEAVDDELYVSISGFEKLP